MNRRGLAAFLLAAGAAALGILLVHFYSFSVDDAFITFRYAENLVAGNGIVFNPGERVEGYTNFLWLLILASGNRLGFDTLQVAKALGIAFAVLTALMTQLAAQHLDVQRPWLRSASVLLLLTTPSFAIYAVSGMETTLFSFLLMLAFYLFLRERHPSKTFSATGLVLLLLTLVRPEGFLFFVVFAAAVFYQRRSWASLVGWMWPYLLLLSIYLIWKLTYFGALLPNTFYAKTGRGLVQYLGGLYYVRSYFQSYGGFLLLLLIMLPTIRVLRTGGKKNGGVVLLLAAVFSWILYNIYKGHDPLPSFRFFVLVLPLVYLLAAVGLDMLGDALTELARPFTYAEGLGHVAVLVVLCAFVLNSGVVSYLSTETHPQFRSYQIQINAMNAHRAFEPMGRRLREIVPPDAHIAVIDAGALPYFSGLHTIDRWGLTDPHIARLKSVGSLGKKFDAKYILEKEPELIQTKVFQRQFRALLQRDRVEISDFIWPGDYFLFTHPKFRSDYRMCDEPVLNSIFARRDLQWKAESCWADDSAESQAAN